MTSYRCTLCGFPHTEIEPLRDHLLDVHEKERGNLKYIEKVA